MPRARGIAHVLPLCVGHIRLEDTTRLVRFCNGRDSRCPCTNRKHVQNSLRTTHAVAGPCSAKSLQALLVSARFTFCGTAFGSVFKERSRLKRAKTLPGHGQNLFTASVVERETRVMNMSGHVRMEDGASTLFSLVACSFLQW